MYHHVSPNPGLVTVSPQVFREHMAWIAAHGYTTVGCDELAAFLAGAPLPKKSVVVTFDPHPKSVVGTTGEGLDELMDAAVKADDWETYIDNALRFHRRLVESSGNRTFLSVWDSLLWDIRGRIALRRHAEMGKSLKPLVKLHKTLLSKLRAQDVAGATGCVEAMLTRVASVFEHNGAAR